VTSEATAIQKENDRPIFGVATLQKWFAVFTRSHHEKCVMRCLTKRGIEGFLPLYTAIHRWTHYREVALDLPLFPNYLFVHISPNERIRAIEVPGILWLVGQGNTADPVPDVEIESLRAALQSKRVEPHPYLVKGTRVRIVTGPLAGREGVIQREKSGLRVVLTMDLIRQSVAVEVNADEIETCSSLAHG
jgi:transcription antitermination factor NusG